MSGDMRPYVVRQGDYLVKLAFVHGFDAEEVWNDPRNDELKKLRGGNHDILAPGDVIYLPVKEKEGLPITMGATNRYVARVPRVEVNLVFKNTDGTPLADEPYEIRGLGAQAGEPKTGGDGGIALKVHVTVREVTVVFPRMHVAHRIHVGHLDPHMEVSGIKHRLLNLGYWNDLLDLEEEEQLALALTAFQASRGLAATGLLDDDTRDALRHAHGR
jgi:putative peptidoglycan binding protein